MEMHSGWYREELLRQLSPISWSADIMINELRLVRYFTSRRQRATTPPLQPERLNRQSVGRSTELYTRRYPGAGRRD
jgi:hypothetical protein